MFQSSVTSVGPAHPALTSGLCLDSVLLNFGEHIMVNCLPFQQKYVYDSWRINNCLYNYRTISFQAIIANALLFYENK